MKATWRYLELAAAFGNFTHEIAVRVSEDADNQWFPCSIIREDDTAGTVDVLATSDLILQTDFPATFIRNAATLTPSPAQGRINHGVDGLPIRPEFGGLDPYWSGVYIAQAGFFRAGDTLLDLAIRTKKPISTLRAIWDLGGRNMQCELHRV